MTRDAAVTLVLTNVALLIAALTQGFLAWMQTRKNGKLATEATATAAKEVNIVKASQKTTSNQVNAIHGLLNEGQIPQLLERAASNKESIDSLVKNMDVLLDAAHANRKDIDELRRVCLARQNCGFTEKTATHG